MKTLTLLFICAFLSVCWSMGAVESEDGGDFSDDTAADSSYSSYDLDSYTSTESTSDPSSESDPDSSASDSSSDSNSDSNSDSVSSESDSDASDSSASDSASSSSPVPSESASEEASHVVMKRDLAAVLLRRRRVAGILTLQQQESLREVCELNEACDDMAETEGIVAAYIAYYGPVPF